jgi:tRNA-splicing ligase RtcB
MNLTEKETNVWEVAQTGTMKVPGRIIASKALLNGMTKDGKTLTQLANIASLPGVCNPACIMPDAHQGYGFPIGGVAAFNLKEGIISPGGVGYDINCGVRILRTGISVKAFLKQREKILEALQKAVPTGVKPSSLSLSTEDLAAILNTGLAWAVKKGYATEEDQEYCEDQGSLEGNAKKVSMRAHERGQTQLGTLGSGNHFLELQAITEIHDTQTAALYGLREGELVIMIHCGSRGLGHQVASDYILKMEKEYGSKHLPDRELAYAPLSSPLGKDYRLAMNAAANFAFVNRQMITYALRNVFRTHFPEANIKLVYDIAHNIAKWEEHEVQGKKQTVCVHRKGATRSFGPGRTELPKNYRKSGCPIFLPGSMGTASYILLGTEKAEQLTFGSTAHGAGRVLSRTFAISNLKPDAIKAQLAKANILLRGASTKGMLEEAPQAYKDVHEVAQVSNEVGIGTLVAQLKPLAVLKG